MKQKWLVAGCLAIATAAFQGCSRQDRNNPSGSADRTSQPAAQTPNSRAARDGFSSEPQPAGSTAGAASGSLDTHVRGGGSTGSADRNGVTATRPSRDSVPNVDPRFAGSQQPHGKDSERGRPGNTDGKQ